MIQEFTLSDQSTATRPVFEAKQIMSSGNAGLVFIFPKHAGKISQMTVRCDATQGSARLKFSVSLYDDVKNGTAKFQNLTDNITGTEEALTIAPVTAITMVRISGTVRLEVIAQ